ncbi:PadR family transcriptional regulator [Myxococcus stipitatus DSM 14675]|uniref:PadR family transcriptional regulator n=1 Tax=Myxococcus stipitatus (strain DSM 14675 / JCM 12634 / Mx s8) TaxID=1278073 RepID=L7UMM3_MYXSD|nr:PadR family transcriptional regulator [Myxococcus stipitatus]AGC49135.1 PadR family transcriptional regulator [Myxococcus stipitatus DSM 14675]
MRIDLLQGTLDMLILKALTGGPMHGYAVTSWLQRTTDDALQVEEGSLYPALHRMTKRGWVKSDWGVSENNRRARFYTLTAEGRRQLKEESSSWARLTEAVAKVLHSRPATQVA